jgi:hypothetical protein
MRRLALVLIAALSLGGCAGPLADALRLATTSFANPVGLNEIYEIDAAYAGLERASLAYFALRQCRASETASLANPCSRYAVKVKLQAADRAVRKVLIPFRAFVKAHDTVQASDLIGPVRDAIASYRATLTTNGVIP